MTTPPGDPSQPYGDPSQQRPQGGYQPFPPYGAPGYPVQQEHPKAITAMVVGILGLVMCQVASPFAWVIGKRAVAEIDASGGRLGGRGQAQTGYVLGIVGTVLLGLGLVFLLIYLVIMVLLVGGMAATSP
jgi:hypothetical protein